MAGILRAVAVGCPSWCDQWRLQARLVGEIRRSLTKQDRAAPPAPDLLGRLFD